MGKKRFVANSALRSRSDSVRTLGEKRGERKGLAQVLGRDKPTTGPLGLYDSTKHGRIFRKYQVSSTHNPPAPTTTTAAQVSDLS